MPSKAPAASWLSAPVVEASLPPCPFCKHPGATAHAWGPFARSNIRLKTLVVKGKVLRHMKCCKCLKRYFINFGQVVRNY